VAVVSPVFLDTTVLVAGVVDTGPASAGSQRVLDAVAEGLIAKPQTAWHCCLEMYSVLTRLPAEYRLSPQEAVRLLETEILSRIQVFQLPPDACAAFLATLADERTTGGRVYDAHIAEIARLAGAYTVVTANRRHFVSLLPHGIRVLTPEEFVEHETL
jgi:predicted nucleic acid-binding protein